MTGDLRSRVDLADSFASAGAEISASAEVVARAQALRTESQRLRSDGERLRFEHQRVRQAIERRRDMSSAGAKPQLFIPSPWSRLPWLLPPQEIEHVLAPVP